MNADEHTKEVYARFGLAVYFAQVLEHGIVNAFIVLDLIPSKRHLAHSRAEWESSVDVFTDKHLEMTMGQMVAKLRSITKIPDDFEDSLIDAKNRRNRLAHSFFRIYAEDFFTFEGREKMIVEVDECRACFSLVDQRLEEIITPLRRNAGITDEMLEKEFKRLSEGKS